MPRSSGETRSIELAHGERIEYGVIGAGPPLVMLHGFLANRFTFSRQLEALGEYFQLILINLRGGAGSSFSVPSNYGIGTSDVDDLRTILDAEELERVSLFGHSSGGATSFVFAIQSPDRVERAVLLEPTLAALMPPTEFSRFAKENERIAAVAKNQGYAAGLNAAVSSAGGEAWAQLDEEVKAERLSALSGSSAFAGPHLLSLNGLRVTEQDVRNLRVPALLLYGANSFWFEQCIADQFRELRPDIRVVTIEDAGHNVHRDQADTVNTETLSFLGA